jgi:hypothetical protein
MKMPVVRGVGDIRRDLVQARARRIVAHDSGRKLGEQVLSRRIDDLLDQLSAALRKDAR